MLFIFDFTKTQRFFLINFCLQIFLNNFLQFQSEFARQKPIFNKNNALKSNTGSAI